MFDRRAAVLVVLALASAIGLSGTTFSSAAFTTTSASTATIKAASDWTPPVVTLASVGSPVKDTVTLTAAASDAETGVASVTMEYLAPDAAGWVAVCTTTTAPYTCAWNTRLVDDGTYDLRATATDRAGYSKTSDTVRTSVANKTLVVLTEPGDVVRGTVPLAATVYNAGGLTYTVRIEYSLAGANSWRSICSNLSAPYTCSWVTTGSAYTNTDYDLRAIATSGGTTLTSVVVVDVTVDNLAPTVSMTDPGTPLRGTRTFAATASDAHSGIDTVTLQYALSGSSTWKVLCTVVDTPYSCRFDTSAIADGSYSFRAVARDVAGNVTTSSSVTNRVVDNTVSSVSMEDPGALLSGTATLAASATSTAPISSVRIQYATTGSSTWTDVCTDTVAPWSCAWDSTKVADGAYDFRAILTPATGAATTSAVLTGTLVDNTPLRGADIQAANGGATVGRLESGDALTYTWTDQLNLSTVTSGWTGGAQPVTVRVRDGSLVGLGDRSDTLDVQRSGGTVNLGSVNLRENHVKSGKSLTFNATMTAGTTTVNGVVRTTVTLRLGSIATGGQFLRTATTSVAMVWSPSAAVTDLNGKVCSTATVTEPGTVDRDF